MILLLQEDQFPIHDATYVVEIELGGIMGYKIP